MIRARYKLAICLGIVLMFSLPGSGGEGKYRLRYWAWWGWRASVSELVENVPVVAVGELISMREAAGIKVRSSPLMYGTDRSQIMTIRVHSVLKGKSLVVPGSIVEALVVPLVGVKNGAVEKLPPSTFAEAYEKYQQTGQWPWYWHYPKIPPNEPQIFFLDKVRERDPRVDESSGVTEVRGITKYHLAKHFYVYADSVEATHKLVSMVSRYVEINNIAESERREEELMGFLMSLIEDSSLSATLATYAAIDLGISLSWRKPGFKWLTENRRDRLIAVAVDRSRPESVRSWVTRILEVAHKEVGLKIQVEPFLRAIADSQDDGNRRHSFISFLEQLTGNTAEVREGFKKILQRDPADKYEAELWERIRQSKILKEEPKQQ